MITIFRKSLSIILFYMMSLTVLFGSDDIILSKYQQTPAKHQVVSSVVTKISNSLFKKNFVAFMQASHPSRMVGTVGHEKAKDFILSFIKSFQDSNHSLLYVQKFIPDLEMAKQFYLNDFKNKIEKRYSTQTQIYKDSDLFTKNVVNALDTLKQVEGQNIIWEKKGTLKPDEFLLLGAHYDTVAFDHKTKNLVTNVNMPGANDNASGVMTALHLIMLLDKMNLKRSVRVIFFDMQDLGFLGGHHYLKEGKLSKSAKETQPSQESFGQERIVGYINLEMLGHDTKQWDKAQKTGNMRAYIRSRSANLGDFQKDETFARGLLEKGKKITKNVDFELIDNGHDGAGHFLFWQQGYPAMMMTHNLEQDPDPRQHTSDDFLETLNMKTLYHSFQFIAGSVISWAFEL